MPKPVSKTRAAFFVGRLMIAVEGGLTLAAADRKRLRHPAVGGVILFARNFESGAQLRQLNADIRRAAGKRILIAVDQEGGRVQRFAGGEFNKLPSAAEYLKSQHAALYAEAAGTVMAAQLLAAGVDFSFAPVLDVRGASEIIGARAFADNAEDAAELAFAFANGMQHAGMQCCGKHFPGHGFAAADSHKTLPVDERGFEEIKARDLKVFEECARAGFPALMTAHVLYPQVDGEPATFSEHWLRRILKDELDFRGLIVSDDLSMEGAKAAGDIGERLQKARAAGCDLFPVCALDDLDDALISCGETNAKTKNKWLDLAPDTDAPAQMNSQDYNRALEVLERKGE